MAISASSKVERIKQYLFYTVLILIFGAFLLLITPLGPGMYYNSIKKANPLDQPVKPWATRSMFQLGRFYQMTLRTEKAQETYKELMYDWYEDHGKEMEIPADDPWVGKAIYWNAEILWDTGFKIQAREQWGLFLDRYDGVPGIEQNLLDNANARMQRY